MPYSKALADRVRVVLGPRPGLTEKRMFGGICFLLNGNMIGGIAGEELMLRLGPDETPRALEEPNTREMDFTGRPMKNFVVVERDGTRSDEELSAWLERGVAFAASLPPK